MIQILLLKRQAFEVAKIIPELRNKDNLKFAESAGSKRVMAV